MLYQNALVRVSINNLIKALQRNRYLILVSLRPLEPARASYMRTVQAIIDALRTTPDWTEEIESHFLKEVKL